MPKILTDEQIAAYAEEGFLFPFPLYSSDEAAELSQKYDALEAACGEAPMDRFCIKAMDDTRALYVNATRKKVAEGGRS